MASDTLPKSALSGSMRKYGSPTCCAMKHVRSSMSSFLPSLARATSSCDKRTSGCWVLSMAEQRDTMRWCLSTLITRSSNNHLARRCQSIVPEPDLRSLDAGLDKGAGRGIEPPRIWEPEVLPDSEGAVSSIMDWHYACARQRAPCTMSHALLSHSPNGSSFLATIAPTYSSNSALIYMYPPDARRIRLHNAELSLLATNRTIATASITSYFKPARGAFRGRRILQNEIALFPARTTHKAGKRFTSNVFRQAA